MVPEMRVAPERRDTSAPVMSTDSPRTTYAAWTDGTPMTVSQEEWRRRFAALRLKPDENAFIKALEKVDTECLECGHIEPKRPAHVQQRHGCRRCAKQVVYQYEWVERFAGVRAAPLADIENVSTKVPALCLDCDQEFRALPEGVQQGNGCPSGVCVGRKIAESKRFSQVEWQAIADGVNARWLEPVVNAASPTPAACLKCGYGSNGEWKPWPMGFSNGAACPKCAKHGLDPAAPTYVYLLLKDNGTAQVGISKIDPRNGRGFTARMNVHGRSGYKLVRKWEVATGSRAKDIEDSVLRDWRVNRGLPRAVTPPREPGRTETVDTSELPINEIESLIESLVADGR